MQQGRSPQVSGVHVEEPTAFENFSNPEPKGTRVTRKLVINSRKQFGSQSFNIQKYWASEVEEDGAWVPPWTELALIPGDGHSVVWEQSSDEEESASFRGEGGRLTWSSTAHFSCP